MHLVPSTMFSVRIHDVSVEIDRDGELLQVGLQCWICHTKFYSRLDNGKLSVWPLYVKHLNEQHPVSHE